MAMLLRMALPRAANMGPAAASCRRASTTAAAAAAADTLARAWATGNWITSPANYPPAPGSVSELYDVHLALAEHPLAQSALGGLAGYKVGAVGAEGETCIYSPLFGRFIVDAPGSDLSSTGIQMHQVEPEFAVRLAQDLPPRPDGTPHRAASLWGEGLIESVSLCVECCGQRGSGDVMAVQTRLGKFQDSLAAGGLVIGAALELEQLTPAALSACTTTLLVNGEVAAEGGGARCPDGGPIEAVAWLANHLNGRGLALQAGQVIATGQTCMTREFAAGDRVEARFEGYGSVEMVVAP